MLFFTWKGYESRKNELKNEMLVVQSQDKIKFLVCVSHRILILISWLIMLPSLPCHLLTVNKTNTIIKILCYLKNNKLGFQCSLHSFELISNPFECIHLHWRYSVKITESNSQYIRKDYTARPRIMENFNFYRNSTAIQ